MKVKRKDQAAALPASMAPKATGVAKRKHGATGKGQRALLGRLEAQQQQQTPGADGGTKADAASARAKARRKRSKNSTILGAIDGMRAELDDLMAANEERQHQRAMEAQDASLSKAAITAKRRQKLVADETAHLQEVLQHPAFVADPFAALAEHLKNTVSEPSRAAARDAKRKAKH